MGERGGIGEEKGRGELGIRSVTEMPRRAKESQKNVELSAWVFGQPARHQLSVSAAERILVSRSERA